MISIIVPVFNAEPYLRQCLDSILNQSYKDFEVLVIDDGSTDSSLSICKKYAERDNRFKVFHKANTGVSATRAFGIEHASGEYSIHVDPDDWISPDHLQMLVGEAERSQADITLCDFVEESADGHIVRSQCPMDLNRLTVIHELLVGTLHGSVCNKLIRNDCYRQTGVNFESRMKTCEDLLVVVSLIWKKADIRLAYVAKATYHYDRYTNTNSLTRNKDNLRAKLFGNISFVKEIDSLFDNNMFAEELNSIKVNILREAFYHKLLTRNEFLSYGKDLKEIYSAKDKKDILDYLAIIALKGHYNACQFIYAIWLAIHGTQR